MERHSVLSLFKLSVLTLTNYLNTNVVDTSEYIEELAKMPFDCLVHLLPYLHYRWVTLPLHSHLTLQMKAIATGIPALPTSNFLACSMRREEDFQRSKNILAGQIPLINVHKDFFSITSFPQERICLNKESPFTIAVDGTVLTTEKKSFVWPETILGEASIVSKEQFLHNFAIFTKNQLQGIDWNNVFVAGGCVTACLTPVPQNLEEEKFYETAYESSDIDIFLYGLAPEEAKLKVVELVTAIKAAYPDERLSWYKTSQTITVFREYPYRCIQLVMSNFQHKAEVLANFDIDCVCVGFDGQDVLCLPRFRDAMNSRVNILNSSLKRVSYNRIIKYQSRGFCFAMPDILTVPFGQEETSPEKIHLLLGFLVLNLLHDYGIKPNEDSLSEWSYKFLNGLTINKARAFQYRTREFYVSVPPITTNRIDEWETSGSIGVSYHNHATHSDINQWKASSDSIEKLHTVWEKKDFEKPWTWEGAPEFNVWTWHGKNATEIASIKIHKVVEKFVLPRRPANQLTVTWYSHILKSSSHTFAVHFNVIEHSFEVTLELISGFSTCNGACLIGINYGGKDIYLDMAFKLTEESKTITSPDITWIYYLGSFDEDCTISVDIRLLEQIIPSIHM